MAMSEPTPYFGLHTPREALAELLDMAHKERGGEFKVKRYKQIRRHLETCRFHGRPLMDEPMTMSSIDAVLKEAWFVVKNADTTEAFIRSLPAQGTA